MLYIFICVHVTNWHPVISAWRTHFGISCKAGVLPMNCLSFCLSGKVFISSSFLKRNFVRSSIFGLHFSYFHLLWIYHHSLMACMISASKLAYNLIRFSCKLKGFLLWLLSFSFCLWKREFCYKVSWRRSFLCLICLDTYDFMN